MWSWGGSRVSHSKAPSSARQGNADPFAHNSDFMAYTGENARPLRLTEKAWTWPSDPQGTLETIQLLLFTQDQAGPFFVLPPSLSSLPNPQFHLNYQARF